MYIYIRNLLFLVQGFGESYLEVSVEKFPPERNSVGEHLDWHQTDSLPVHQEPVHTGRGEVVGETGPLQQGTVVTSVKISRHGDGSDWTQAPPRPAHQTPSTAPSRTLIIVLQSHNLTILQSYKPQLASI